MEEKEQETNTKVSIMQKLADTPAQQIVNLPEVADRFKALYVTFNGKNSERYYEAEKFHFAKILQENPKLTECTKLSLYGCFLDVAVNGLSFDRTMNHLYIVPYKHKTIVKVDGINKEVWETRAQVQISGTGELLLRMKQGQIKYADNPVLVYEGDLFKMGTRDNSVYLEHEIVLPRKDEAEILACYLKITRNDDTVDYKILTKPELMKLRAFSKDPDSKAWTIGLPGMFQMKTIKHSFKSYPKLRLLQQSKFTALQSETIDELAETVETNIYNLEENKTDGAPVLNLEQNQIQQPEIPEHDDDFAAAPTQTGTQGVVFDEDDFTK